MIITKIFVFFNVNKTFIQLFTKQIPTANNFSLYFQYNNVHILMCYKLNYTLLIARHLGNFTIHHVIPIAYCSTILYHRIPNKHLTFVFLRASNFSLYLLNFFENSHLSLLSVHAREFTNLANARL